MLTAYLLLEPTQSACTKAIARLLNDPTIKSLLDDRATNQYLDSKIGDDVTLKDVIDFLLLRPMQYDIIQIDANNNVTHVNAAEMHHLLYSYIINRATAVAICRADEYFVRDGCHTKTDDAFLQILNALVKHESVQTKEIAGSRKHVLKLEGKKIEAAFRIIKEEPMKFKVQRPSTPPQQGLDPVEIAVFCFTPAQNGAWDTGWETVSQSYAVCFFGDEKYEF